MSGWQGDPKRVCDVPTSQERESLKTCGRGGFFKRSQRSEALQCYHMFANTKKAPFQRFCFLS